MVEFEKLVSVLEREIAEQEKLLGLLTQERAAIVKAQSERINEINSKKESLLDDVRELEEERRSLVEKIHPAPPVQNPRAPIKKVTLTDVLSDCTSPALRDKLSQVGGELKSIAKTVQALNSQNAELIRHSLGLVTSTLAIFESSAPENDLPTYQKSGTLKGPTPNGRTRSAA